MDTPTCSNEPSIVLVADTSVIINLNASGHAQEILMALGSKRVTVVDVISDELERGRSSCRADGDRLNRLIADGLLDRVELDSPALKHFEQLTIGSAADTLDDGEAATISYALIRGAVALIDERKANRVCAERFSGLSVGSTLDVFRETSVVEALGTERLAAAVFDALRIGRMRVLPDGIDWVVSLIGPERAALCPSLPAAVRQRC